MIDFNTFTIERFSYVINNNYGRHEGVISPLSMQVANFYLLYAVSIYMMGIVLGLFYILIAFWIILLFFGEENKHSSFLSEMEPSCLLLTYIMLADWVVTVHFMGELGWYKISAYLLGTGATLLYLFVVLGWYFCADDAQLDCPIRWLFLQPSPWVLIVTFIFLVPFLCIFTSYLMKKPKRYNYDPIKLNWSAFRISNIMNALWLTFTLPFLFLFLRIRPASSWLEHRFVMH